jgi:hypothetical protein
VQERWREVVEQLAGGDAVLTERFDKALDLFVATAEVPDALLSGMGDTPAQALRRLAHSLGDFRLIRALEGGGWTEIDEVIDEVTYVVARDPIGSLWAIGVATVDGDRREYIQTDIEYDHRTFDRVAFVEPIDARDWGSLNAALEAST